MPSAPDVAIDTSAEWWEIEPQQHGVFDRALELWRYRYLWWYFAADTLTAQFRRSKLGWLRLLFRVAGPVGLNAAVFGGVLGVESGGPQCSHAPVAGSSTVGVLLLGSHSKGASSALAAFVAITAPLASSDHKAS